MIIPTLQHIGMKKSLVIFLVACTLIRPLSFVAQINAYAKVTGITSGSVLAVNNLNQTNGNFVVGQQVIIMQMQGATIADNTNASTFGTLSSLNSTGLYEVRTVSAINGGTSVITVTPQVQNTYAVADNVQIISFPKLGTAAFTTTANITGVAWNGNVGGVVAFWVDGNLNLNHNISADAIGFRGGLKAGSVGGNCETNVFRTTTGDARYANKGEGICMASVTTWVAGRAKIVNGGGGGIVHNGGGGGGGNFTSGGIGYLGFSGECNATLNAGGQGGLAVSSSADRVFMGGGGGGGQENNNLGTSGGNGGGIILFKCDTLVVAGTCTGRTISANGGTVAAGGNDGQGGGGAGGSIVLDIKGMQVQTTCPLLVAGNGGAGGNVGNGGTHGAGGGGGQGAIYIRSSGPFTNAVLATISGTGGAANSGGSPPVAGSGSGTPGSGVSSGNSTIPLPVSLTSFMASDMGEQTAEIYWQTASEKHNREFHLMYSNNSENWSFLTAIAGKGTYSGISSYRYIHKNLSAGRHYYQLRQIDDDGTTNKVGICAVMIKDQTSSVKLSPNPCSDLLTIKYARAFLTEEFRLCDGIGNCGTVKGWISNDYSISFDVSSFQQGVYFLTSQSLCLKVIIVR